MAGFSRDKAAPVATVVSVAVLVAATVAAFLVGSSSVSLGDLVAWATGGDVAASAKSILVNVRLPRVLAALKKQGFSVVSVSELIYTGEYTVDNNGVQHGNN